MKFIADVGTSEIKAKLYGENKENVVYLVVNPELGAFEELDAAPELDCSVIAFGVNVWFRDLTPWEAPGVFPGDDPFPGKAPEFVKEVLAIGARVEKDYGISAKRRFIAGHSLGGLFSIWTTSTFEGFDGFGSISGSVWYDGLFDYMRESQLLPKASKGYFCIGDLENDSPIDRFKDCLPKTVTAKRIADELGLETTFSLEKGEHSDNVTERTMKAIKWLIG